MSVTFAGHLRRSRGPLKSVRTGDNQRARTKPISGERQGQKGSGRSRLRHPNLGGLVRHQAAISDPVDHPPISADSRLHVLTHDVPRSLCVLGC
jgi:hypothetical protein